MGHPHRWRGEARTDETVNKTMPTGEIELYAHEIEVLSVAKELPLPVFGGAGLPGRRAPEIPASSIARAETLHRNSSSARKIISAMRKGMGEIGFAEYTTPILTASSPKARATSSLPSRIHEGKFFALPQAPQHTSSC